MSTSPAEAFRNHHVPSFSTLEEYKEKLHERLEELKEQGYMTAENEHNYERLCCRFFDQMIHKTFGIDWTKVVGLTRDDLVDVSALMRETLSDDEIKSLLDQVVVLKLNGGLGTSMGCSGAKSCIQLKDDLTFIHIMLNQVRHLNTKYDVDIPFVFMNSGRTDFETRRVVEQANPNGDVSVFYFEQPVYPRLTSDTLLPVEIDPLEEEFWYPPGHASVYSSFIESGLLEEMAKRGKKWIFISNADNLGATPDPHVIHAIDRELERDPNLEFFLEATPKTLADVKGGTPILYDGKHSLLELAQVPIGHTEDFTDIRVFSTFNTNNMWVSIEALKKPRDLDFPIICNPKTMIPPTMSAPPSRPEAMRGISPGEHSFAPQPVIQLEMACGSAIGIFHSSVLCIPRSRFIPVKMTNDLMRLQSDLFRLNDDWTVYQISEHIPRVILSSEYKTLRRYNRHVLGAPSLLNCKSLVLDGDIIIEEGVTFEGDVVIRSSKTFIVRKGTVLKDKEIDV